MFVFISLLPKALWLLSPKCLVDKLTTLVDPVAGERAVHEKSANRAHLAEHGSGADLVTQPLDDVLACSSICHEIQSMHYLTTDHLFEGCPARHPTSAVTASLAQVGMRNQPSYLSADTRGDSDLPFRHPGGSGCGT